MKKATQLSKRMRFMHKCSDMGAFYQKSARMGKIPPAERLSRRSWLEFLGRFCGWDFRNVNPVKLELAFMTKKYQVEFRADPISGWAFWNTYSKIHWEMFPL